jgi:hypothetical protein
MSSRLRISLSNCRESAFAVRVEGGGGFDARVGKRSYRDGCTVVFMTTKPGLSMLTWQL